jgi:Domain of unknown function (DUF4192)
MTTTLTARGPGDLLAAVPVVLGFHPHDSLVMLTFGAERTFHARVDLPARDDDEELTEIVETLLAPCRMHEVDHVAFVVYSGDRRLAAALAAALVPAFAADGIGVVDVLRAHEGGWSSVPVRADARESPPVPYDAAHHPFTAQAVFDGRVTLASRDELRATVAPDAELRHRWAGRVSRLPPPESDDAEAAHETVAAWVATGDGPDDDGAARVLGAVTRIDVRDAALFVVTPETAPDHLRVWAALLRGAPDPQVPDVAAVTAFCAWQSGHGALAWCALDRCFEIDAEHRLGRCLAECLVRAVPPTAWTEVVEAE